MHPEEIIYFFYCVLHQWFSTSFALGPMFYVGHQVMTQHYTKIVYHMEVN